MEHLFDMRPERPGYRLQLLEVFNWGTFDSSDGTVHRFEPRGRTSLLVGHNGSGKSTLVDALLTLLVDSRTRNYNVAAGAKKTERTARSYIKGAYNRTSDEETTFTSRYLRPAGNHLTAISAVLHDEQAGKSFTLTQILYLKSDSDDKIFAIIDQEKSLRDVLTGLTRSDEVREHLKQQGFTTTKVYVEYQGWLTKRTSMRGKAIDMFNQTVHVKDIQSLNEFIRRHMLEAHDWRDKVQRLLTHFEDLSLAHQELTRARRANELLEPLEKLGNKYRQRSETLEQLEQQLAAASSYFPYRVKQLFEPEIIKQQATLDELQQRIVRLDQDLKSQRESIRQIKNEIDLAGGERLRKIPELLKTERAYLQHKQSDYRRFHDHLKICGIDSPANTPARFDEVRDQLHETQRSAREQSIRLRSDYEQAIGEKASVKRTLREEREELEVLQRRRSNLPGRFEAVRSQICGDLNLDENVLPFAAELIAVLPEQRNWEASLEMVLRPFALSLLVPSRYYPRVRAYIESNHLRDRHGEGQRLDYICVGRAPEATGDRLADNSSLHKLRFRNQHDLTPWVRGEVAKRFDFHCCESHEEFNDIPRMALTANRHVKFNSERHQKDDRSRTVDPRYFVLGWDNTDKKRRIAEHIQQLEAEAARLSGRAEELQAAIEQQQHIDQAASGALQVSDFDTIDVNRHKQEIVALEAEQRELEQSNDAVQSLKQRLQDAELAEQETSRQRDLQLNQKGMLAKDIENAQRILNNAQDELDSAQASGQFEVHQQYFEAIAVSLGDPPLSIEDVFIRKDRWSRATEVKIADLRKPLEELREKLVNRMTAYLQEFRESSADLNARVESLDSFLGLLEQLRHEDLPKYEKKFKDRLNDQVLQEVGLFNNELRQECKRIEDKVAQLNQALAEVAYNRGTLMRLDPRRVQDREIDEFRRALSECLDEAIEQTDEANEQRFLRIQALIQRLADKERSTWRNKVIDVRNWYDFAAREIDRESGQTRSSYDGSSGQSGGEKAKLAFTILVAALAYQFDVDPNGHTAERFQFVVVDEMFSKVDDQNAIYALKLFKQFGLQLLIVAPLDAKARVTEPFVDRYLHAVKDPVSSKSHLYSMTAQEYEEVAKSFSADESLRQRLPSAK